MLLLSQYWIPTQVVLPAIPPVMTHVTQHAMMPAILLVIRHATQPVIQLVTLRVLVEVQGEKKQTIMG